MADRDVFAEIRARINPADYNLTKAEGRVAIDKALRRELDKIRDKNLREHAAGMIREWRWQIFAGVDTSTEFTTLSQRVAAIEARLGITPKFTSREITQLRTKPEDF